MYSKVVFLCCLLSADAAPHVYDQSQNGQLNVQVDLKDLQIFALLNGQHEEYYEDIDYAYDYSEMTIKPQTGTSKKPLSATIVDTTSSEDNVTAVTTANALIDSTEPPKYNSQEIETTPITNITNDNSTPTSVNNDMITMLNNITSKSNLTLDLQSRKEDGVPTTSKKMNETTAPMDQTTNGSDLVTGKPQTLMSNISPVKSETESTTKSVNTVGSNVTTKLSTSNSICKKGFVLNQRGGCDLKIQSMSNALLKIVKLSQKLKSRRHRRNVQDTH